MRARKTRSEAGLSLTGPKLTSSFNRRVFVVACVPPVLLLGVISGMESYAVDGLPEVGTVETVAGPSSCPRGARADSSPPSIGPLSVGPEGTLHFVASPLRTGIIGEVRPDGQAQPIPTVYPGGLDQKEVVAAGKLISRLVPDAGGAILATPYRLVGLKPSDNPVLGRVSPVLTTIIGLGPADMSNSPQDNLAPASQVRLKKILGVAGDLSGNLFIADELDPQKKTFRILLFNRSPKPLDIYPGVVATPVPPGHLVTIAGRDGDGNSGDGELAKNAVVSGEPPGLTVAHSRLYVGINSKDPITGENSSYLRMMNLGAEKTSIHGVEVEAGAIQTVAGGPSGFSGNDNALQRAKFSRVGGISADEAGNLYVADRLNQRVRRVDRQGMVSTVAGRGSPGQARGGYNGEDRPAAEALLSDPVDVKIGPADAIYIADRGNALVRYVDKAGMIHAAQGNGVASPWRCEGKGGLPNQWRPNGIADTRNGSAFFGLADQRQIMRIDGSGVISGVLGTPRDDTGCVEQEACNDGDGRPANQASLAGPASIETHPRGGLYFLDGGSGKLRFYNDSKRAMTVHGREVGPGRVVSLIGKPVGRRQEKPIRLSGRGSLAVTSDEVLLLVDSASRRIYELDKSGELREISSLFGGSNAIRAPAGIVADPRGNAYVSDASSYRIWYINRTGRRVRALGRLVKKRTVTPVAGTGTSGFGGDGGSALDAQFQGPAGIALGSRGDLFIADSLDHSIRRIDGRGLITTVVGAGQFGFNGDGLKGRGTRLNRPADVAMDSCGNLLIADQENGRVRKLGIKSSCEPQVPKSSNGSRGGVGFLPAIPLSLSAAIVLVLMLRRSAGRN